MTFSQYAGSAIVPTLARLVLAAAFVSAGWNKVFKQAEFTVEEATQLRSLNVNVEPVLVTSDATRASERHAGQVLLTSWQQEASPPPAAPSDSAMPGSMRGNDAAPEQDDPDAPSTEPVAGGASPPAADPSVASPPAAQPPLAPGTYKAQALHKVTLMLNAHHFPMPVWQARLAAFTELIGGAMLLLGLFSRIWGLGLAISMGVAFYLVSMKTNGIFQMDPRVFAENIGNFNTAYCQAGLCVLALGVFLTGAGPLSLDRMLFGGGGDAQAGDGKID